MAFLALAVIAVAWLPGCNRDQTSPMDGTFDELPSNTPGLDVNGGEATNEYSPVERLLASGEGGDAGTIRVYSNSASASGVGTPAAVDINKFNPTTPPTPALTGTGITVLSGEEVHLSGAYLTGFLSVEAGGRLILDSNALFVLDDSLGSGHAVIAGEIRSSTGKDTIDGWDLTIDADGMVLISGLVNTSGRTVGSRTLELMDYYAGGSGGEIYISGAADGTTTPGVHVSGRVLSDGGDTFSTDTTRARAGRGGQILIGSATSLQLTGRVSARGGRSYVTASGNEGVGGQIEIVAEDEVILYGLSGVWAQGGASSTSIAGTGGDVRFEAPLGEIASDGIDIEASGGNPSYAPTALGGTGGNVTFTGSRILLDGVASYASGGVAHNLEIAPDSLDPSVGGYGGAGGTVQMGGSVSVAVTSTTIDAGGGASWTTGALGGAGGTVRLISTGGTGSLSFTGDIGVIGGRDFLGSRGPDGTICTTGATTAAVIAIAGYSNFPPKFCTENDADDLVLHSDLSCDDTGSWPSEMAASIPVIIGVNYYRVYITPSMKSPPSGGSPTHGLTITTRGAEDGQLQIYVGCDSVLGTNPPNSPLSDGAYFVRSSGVDGEASQTICIDTTSIPAGRFISVAVVERTTFVEDYTITVSCSTTVTGCTAPTGCSY